MGNHPSKMGQIEFTVPDDVEEEFRRQSRAAFGHRRDALDRAGEQALREWTERRSDLHEHVEIPDDPVDVIDEMLVDVDADSVSLAHRDVR